MFSSSPSSSPSPAVMVALGAALAAGVSYLVVRATAPKPASTPPTVVTAPAPSPPRGVATPRSPKSPMAGTATKSDLAELEARLRREVHGMSPSPLVTAGKEFPPVPHLLRTEQKRIMVTGGAGFVGSHLVDVLMRQGHIVYVLDNLYTGRRRNLAHWFGHPNFQFFQRDVIHPHYLEVDEIYHLACPASPPHYQYNQIKTIKCSVMGTLNMLGLAKRCEARILFTSTSEVYGDPEVHPQVESYNGSVNCIGPRACYDEGKRVAETMCMAYREEHGVDVRVCRIFNTFGSRMHPDDGRVVSNFIKQALTGQDLTVYGDGQQTRSFQYVADLVRGLVKLMASDVVVPVNLGNPEEFTIKDFAEYIVKKVNPTSGRVVHKPATSDDPQRRRPDITRAKTMLGWEPQVSVEEGLDQAILYFRNELGLPPRDEDPPVPDIWMPDIPDDTLGCMATRRRARVYK